MAKAPRRKAKRKLSVNEWCFSETKLSEDELLICCRYEYARESPTIRRVLEENHRADDELREQIEWDHLDLYLAFHSGKKSFSQPWLAKKKSERRKILESIPSKQAIEIFSHGQFDPSEGEYIGEEGFELLHLKINWRYFTDEEIVQMFSRWVKSKEVRPPLFPSPQKRGKSQNDMLRNQLDALGILRLLHAMPFKDFPDQRPHGDKWRIPFTARKTARMTKDHLRETFPFLPEDEIPLSSKIVED